jgi:hypothetical protein
MGTIDGGSVSFNRGSRIRIGVAAGRGVGHGVSGLAEPGARYGGYVETHVRGRRGSWRALVSSATLRDPDVVRRSFVFVRNDVMLGHRYRLFQNLELDLNPRWKRELGEPSVGVTAWSIGNQLSVGRRLSLLVGLDSRRTVLLPEMRHAASNLHLGEHLGVRGSARIQATRHQSLRIGADVRW